MKTIPNDKLSQVEAYAKTFYHYPRIAKEAAKHINLYTDCNCNIWLPIANSKEVGEGFKNAISCFNCKVFVTKDSGVDDAELRSNVYLYEYASFVLETHSDHYIQLCKCCYDTISSDFINMK